LRNKSFEAEWNSGSLISAAAAAREEEWWEERREKQRRLSEEGKIGKGSQKK
jgi:hypothetical protein